MVYAPLPMLLYFSSFLLCWFQFHFFSVELTAPIDVYCMWRDELEAENVDPATYGDEIDD